MYEYRANVLRVVDGDTLWVDVDLGCDTHLAMTVRLNGVNAPEHNTPAGEAATEYVTNWVHNHGLGEGAVVLRTTKDRKEKFGRYLGNVFGWVEGYEGPADPELADRELNKMLVWEGHAIPYFGGPR